MISTEDCQRTEVTERLEEGDITKDILMQLGMLVSCRAYNVGMGGGEGEEAVEEYRRREDLRNIEKN